MAEANKEDIDKCLSVAKESLASGDVEKAGRFLAKAQRMGASSTMTLSDLKNGAAAATESPQSRGEPSSSTRQRPAAAAASRSSGEATRVNKDGRKYTSDQVALVQRILRTKDYYAMLQIPKDCDEETMKKAYKKTALKLHPDKNTAPGAEEAFKKVSKAFQCLSDAQHKAAYDQYGDEDRIPRAERHFDHGEYMTPEDLFNNLFGGGMHRPQYHGGGGRQEQERNPLIQFLPFVFLVLVSLMSNISSFSSQSRPQFSFKPTTSFRYARESRGIKINYYVGDDFHSKYPPQSADLKLFEKQVEFYYIQNVNSECDHEEKLMINRLQLAKRYGRQDEAKRISRTPLPACKELERLKKQHPKEYKQALYDTY